MNETHHDSLKQYVNDMIGLEHHIINAVSLQREEDRVKIFGDLPTILDQLLSTSEARLVSLKKLSLAEDGAVGAAFKEGITSIAGSLAGLYGKIREHAVSKMVRDDIIAVHVTSIGYGMLLSLALAIGHEECAALATEGIEQTPPLIIALTDLLPMIVVQELAEDAPLKDPLAGKLAAVRIREAWGHA